MPEPIINRCEFCSAELPPAKPGGRRRRFCDNKGRCRKAAARQRALEKAQPWCAPHELKHEPEEPVEAFLIGRQAPVDDQIVSALHETKVLAGTFRRLSTEARPQLAPRASGMAEALDGALDEHFPGVFDDG